MAIKVPNVPNLCGASDALIELDTFLAAASANFDGVGTNFTDAIEAAKGDFDILLGKMQELTPPVPELPDINFPSQIKALTDMIPGTLEYANTLAKITTDFAPALLEAGHDLTKIVEDSFAAIASGDDVCSICPNFTLPAAGGEAKEIAKGVKHPVEKTVSEEPSIINASKPLFDQMDAARKQIEEAVPTIEATAQHIGDSLVAVANNSGLVKGLESGGAAQLQSDLSAVAGTILNNPVVKDVGAWAVAQEDNITKIFTHGQNLPVVLPENQDGKNISSEGFTKRVGVMWEEIKLADMEELVDDKGAYGWKFKLKHSPMPGSRSHHVRIKGNVIRGHAEDYDFDWDGTQGFFKIRGYEISSDTPIWEVYGNEVIVKTRGVNYIPHEDKRKSKIVGYMPKFDGVVFLISYYYYQKYDPGLNRTDEDPYEGRTRADPYAYTR